MGLANTIASRLSVEKLNQGFLVSHFIRSRKTVTDKNGAVVAEGLLQSGDLQIAMTMFAHRYYVRHCVQSHGADKGLWIYQVQIPQGNGFRIFGTLVADDDGNFIMNCVETDIPRQIQKNREVMRTAKRMLCK